MRPCIIGLAFLAVYVGIMVASYIVWEWERRKP